MHNVLITDLPGEIVWNFMLDYINRVDKEHCYYMYNNNYVCVILIHVMKCTVRKC